MGTITSKDTRRISFDNTFALSPPLTVKKCIKDDDSILALDSLAAEKPEELLFPESKCVEYHEDGEIAYWGRRIDTLKKEHQIINKILENEYEKTIEHTNKLLAQPQTTPKKVQDLKPCLELRSKIIKCYQDNPHQPLMCTSIVQAFTQCVDSCRLQH